jgi:hypothetical protein
LRITLDVGKDDVGGKVGEDNRSGWMEELGDKCELGVRGEPSPHMASFR